jgi:hypothetical protein
MEHKTEITTTQTFDEGLVSATIMNNMFSSLTVDEREMTGIYYTQRSRLYFNNIEDVKGLIKSLCAVVNKVEGELHGKD